MEYISEIILCLLAVAAIPMSLTKRPLKMWQRLLPVESLIVFGAVFFLITRNKSGLYAALMGVVCLLFVVFHPKKQANENENETLRYETSLRDYENET